MANKKIKGTNKKLLTRSRKYQNGGLTLQTKANVLSPQQMKEFGVVPQLQGTDTSRFEGSGGSGGINMGMAGGIASLASAATTDILNVINEAKGADLTDIKAGITRSQIDTSVKSFDDIQNQYSNLTTGRTWTAKDLGAKGAGKMIGNSFAQAAKGAMAGSSLGPWGMLGGAIGGQVSSLFGSILGNRKRKKQARELNELQRSMDRFNLRTLAGQSQAVGSDISRNLNINYAALGGPMDFGGGAIGYDFMNQYLNTKELAALGQDASLSSLPNSFAKGGRIHIKESNKGKFTDYCGGDVTAECIARGKRSSSPAIRKRATFADNAKKWKHALGGSLLTHGANFPTGLIHVDNGGTHEENPYEGVVMGVDSEGIPNLVEEGEVIYNDYVFSDRLKVPESLGRKYKLKKGITFASAIKKLSEESEERPNDPISRRGLEAFTLEFANAQEELRMESELKKSKSFAHGGHLGIRYDGKGTKSQKLNTWKKDDINDFQYWNGSGYDEDYLNFVNNIVTYDDIINLSKIHPELFSRFLGSNPDYKYNLDEARKWSTDKSYSDWHKIMEFLYNDYSNNLPENNIPAIGIGLKPSHTLEEYEEERKKAAKTREGREPLGGGDSTEIIADGKLTEVKEGEGKVPVLPTGMRYAPIAASGILGLTDSLGWTNKPDYSEADMLLDAINGPGNYSSVSFDPIGNYLTYKPFDRNYFLNQLHSQQGATRRALLQNAGLNRGNASAALLAADYNAGLQEGALARQAEEYKLAQGKEVEGFNRGTDMFNSEGIFKAAWADQEARLKSRDTYLKGIMTAAGMRQSERQQSTATKTANLTNFIQGIGDLGRENFEMNMINQNPALYYYLTQRGGMGYKGSNGGMLTRRKRRHGKL